MDKIITAKWIDKWDLNDKWKKWFKDNFKDMEYKEVINKLFTSYFNWFWVDWLIKRLLHYDDRNRKLYEIFVSESVLPIFEEKYPNEKRPREAILADKDYLQGKINKSILLEKHHKAIFDIVHHNWIFFPNMPRSALFALRASYYIHWGDVLYEKIPPVWSVEAINAYAKENEIGATEIKKKITEYGIFLIESQV